MDQEKKKEQEQRLNELVQEWFGLSTERDSARKTALYQQIMLVFFEYMDWLDVKSLEKMGETLPVRHYAGYADMEAMGLDAFKDALDHYDPSKGMFSHYFNTILSRRKYNRCNSKSEMERSRWQIAFRITEIHRLGLRSGKKCRNSWR